MHRKPEILAPAGDTSAFLAAIAAGADAVYLGLKHFSARMQADNFGLTELSRLVELAHTHDRRVYVALNTMLKPGDPDAAGRLIARLARDVMPDALILQDLGVAEVARQAGFKGELHFSTLANVTHADGLRAAKAFGADRVILPRELNIDEVRSMGEACPEGLDLELFVHGALCYCVSGRCYWSSYMGGKSGLRGRCVQPCRRVYRQKGREGRYFSCLDLSLDVLSKTLLDVPNLSSWKIEGRKKGPHYVFHVVTAYRMLRDNPDDPQVRKDAERILKMALGRPGTHAGFLPQRSKGPTAFDEQTSSGLLVGKIQHDKEGTVYFKPRIELLPQDYLRIGYEDEPWHATQPVPRRIPKAGSFTLRMPRHKTPKAGTPVFLIDRREPEMMHILREWQNRLAKCHGRKATAVDFEPKLPAPVRGRKRPDMVLRSSVPHGMETRGSRGVVTGLWLSPKSVQEVSRTVFGRMAWWLSPVIWPDEEDAHRRMVVQALRNGARHFVLNAPWQLGLFPERDDLDFIAGPFCNIGNAAALACLREHGFSAAIVSPELAGEDLLALPKESCLPLGVVLSGFWPMGIARHQLEGVKPGEPFSSPKGEVFWARRYGQNTWIYPGWPLDISARRAELDAAGYAFGVRIDEYPPKNLPEARRASTFNWDLPLL
ncbi:peptidase U32 family protein [Nitratidesulfovibrio vulgaris]|jgi:putative protease|uniref:Peptidase, U32 family n=2 Tax=Nitratidesulfovibrio vulgaris TaxID=881 RepID=Q725W1_NITV2|nr:peptidase U32 family protein [Nitratidesulfovibrio vulgaris]AAS97782.1 peptidase, U32 family [Nitratidesulfovibrio vulgaris str. Hildenborough]ADP88204.1 peptidase U32 [Nitratidesulfovibrio vulgaris RCH1]WCB46694.1 U32 family peptidase [Nitratidesulfovibrio vulgaris]